MSEKLKTILIFICFLLLYFVFRSAELDVTEGIALDYGVLYSPNHMLSRPIANVVWKISKIAGYDGRSVHVLQLLNIFYGALTVAISFAAYRKLGASLWAALAGCILLGTSFIFWYESTDAYYIVLSGIFSAAALLCSAIFIQKPSLLNSVLLAVCFACATLSWQAVVLLFPIFAWPLRRRFKELMMFAVTVSVILIISYVAAGIAQGNTTVNEFVHWATHHGGGNIPWWGKFEIYRIKLGLVSAVQSIQIDTPHWLVDFIRSTNHHEPRSASAAVIFLILLAIAGLIRGIQIVARGNSIVIWLLGGYFIIFAFLVWWEPVDLKNFFVPNIFLCAAASIVFSSWTNIPVMRAFVFTAIAVVAVITFCFTIWQRHTNPGSNVRKADCVYQNVSSKDKVISTDWNFTAELFYFYQMRTVEIVSRAAEFHDHGKLIDHVNKEIEQTQKNGGKVFIVDPNSYAPEYRKWLAEQTSFSTADFERFPGKFAFQCEELKYREVIPIRK